MTSDLRNGGPALASSLAPPYDLPLRAYLGAPGLAGDVDDVRAHGRDERVAVKSFFDGGEYLYRLVKRLADGK